MFFILISILLGNICYSHCDCQQYRNGATSSDNDLCEGPRESWGRPCYPYYGYCNSDWNYCDNSISYNCYTRESWSDC